MKRWTVMLIPHDRSNTRTLEVASWHFSAVVSFVILLTFTSTFLFQRHNAVIRKNDALKEINRAMELRASQRPQMAQAAPVAASESLSDEEVKEIEARLRAEYEASITAITAELGDLYDAEAKAREITGIGPRRKQRREEFTIESNGKGGGPGDPINVAYAGGNPALRPPHVIYGLSRPSADLILQEIRMRTQSFGELVTDMEAEIDRIERIPAIWPLARRAGKITSRFGYRRDPFHGRVRLHSGVDVAAKYGTPVVATAKGKVIFSGYDKFYGNLVKVDHGNGIQTWYAHMSKRNVDEGQKVQRGEQVGKLGSSGRSTGPHLHYEVHKNAKAVDALTYMD
jgi:murein DD-endopeptidase MepM/ murein hydrolase activator NlpD